MYLNQSAHVSFIFTQAIGRFGAKALLSAVTATGRRARVHGAVRVLTHCNTGSLATAAYGTALGVIRALHEQGKLEHAYCTETRPYNQGGDWLAVIWACGHDALQAICIVCSFVELMLLCKQPLLRIHIT